MPTFTSSLDGVDQFQGVLYAWQAEKTRQVGALVVATTKAVLATAREKAPKRTGRLIDSLEADVADALTDLVGAVIAGAFYAGFVERGTANLAAHPFLFPAFEVHARPFYDGLRQILTS